MGRVAIALCLAFAVMFSVVVSASALTVTFADANLEAAVRSALAKPSGAISDADMAGLTSFTARSRQIKALGGMQYAVNLNYLDLSNNAIASVSPLSALAKVQTLKLDGNLISDLTPLQSLPNLGYLQLNRNRISNLGPVANMTKLSELRVETNRFTSIAPLANLPKIRVLYLACNRLRDITPLRDLTTLDQLDLPQNEIRDVSALSGLTNLHTLNLDENWISNITPIAALPLTQADVSVNMLDLTPGSSAMQTIAGWQSRGATVVYRPQRTWAVRGTVTKLGLGTAVSGVTIWNAGHVVTKSSSRGGYVMRFGLLGTQRFVYTKRYYYSAVRYVKAHAGVTFTVNVPLKPTLLTPKLTRYPSVSSIVRWRSGTYARFKLSVVMRDARGLIAGAPIRLQKRTATGWQTVYTLKTNSQGKATKTLKRRRSITFWRWYAPATIGDRAKATTAQRIRAR